MDKLEIEHLKQNRDDLLEQLRKSQESQNDLREQVESLKSLFTSLEKHVQDSQNQLETISNERNQSLEQVSKLQNIINEKDTEIEDLHRFISESTQVDLEPLKEKVGKHERLNDYFSQYLTKIPNNQVLEVVELLIDFNMNRHKFPLQQRAQTNPKQRKNSGSGQNHSKQTTPRPSLTKEPPTDNYAPVRNTGWSSVGDMFK